MKITDYYSNKLHKIRNNRFLVIVYFILFPVTLIAGSIQSVLLIISLFSTAGADKPIIVNYYNTRSETDSSIYKIKFNYLLFQDRKSFNLWHSEVKFRMGFPRYGRNALSDKIDSSTRTENYSKYKENPDQKDKRIICGADYDLPKDLIDEYAERKYKFIKISTKEAEEMGFIKDEPADDTLNIIPFKVNQVTPFKEGIEIRPALNYIFYPEHCIDAVLKLNMFSENRNKYILDFGSQIKRNRLSLYLDRSNNLCFRFIDSASHAYGIKINTDVLNGYFYLHCKFATNKQMAYMEIYINGHIVAQKVFYNKIIYGNQVNVFSTLGSNLNGEYFGGFECGHVFGYQNYLGEYKYFIKHNADDLKNVILVNGKVAKIKAS